MVFALECIGTVAFAVSGAMTALKKHMDLFGVIMLALITSVGGGVIRDVILGKTPPATFRNPVYAIIAAVTAIIVCLPFVRKLFKRYEKFFDYLLFLMDTLGLGIFTVVGIDTAFSHSHHYSAFLMCFVGVITGVGGGLMRDMMAGDIPYIFSKHIYAIASIEGALVCIWMWDFSPMWAMFCGAALIVIVRILARHFHWGLPRASLQ